MIYIDKFLWNGKYYSHLMTDKDIEELHVFAQRIGLKREWFQDHPEHPHYDILSEKYRKRALEFGAKMINFREVSKLFKEINRRSN